MNGSDIVGCLYSRRVYGSGSDIALLRAYCVWDGNKKLLPILKRFRTSFSVNIFDCRRYAGRPWYVTHMMECLKHLDVNSKAVYFIGKDWGGLDGMGLYSRPDRCAFVLEYGGRLTNVCVSVGAQTPVLWWAV